MEQLHVICDLQYGSCGKGLYAGALAKMIEPDTIVTAWAPNAGHTFIDEEGAKFVNISLPNGIVAGSVRRVLIGPGSVINPEIMWSEYERYIAMMEGIDLIIHPFASVVNEGHRATEGSRNFKIGSTMKGVGAAVIQKIERDPDNINVARVALLGTPLESFVVTVDEYNECMDRARIVLLEGAQGFSLSINQGFYPFTTSRDCTVTQLMSDCAIPMMAMAAGAIVAHGVCRTYPIRVANRFDTKGKQIGWSGPCYSDQKELQWSEVGVEPELTTVTKLPRRIFTFSREQIIDAVRMNGVGNIFLNFCNYPQEANGKHINELIEDINCIAPVMATGWGPKSSDIKWLNEGNLSEVMA